MTTLTEKFAALETQLSTEAATTAGYIDTVEAKLQAIFDELDLILLNNAANTKYLLAALGQTGACFPCPTPSITVPVITTTPTSVDNPHCQRSQWIVTAMQNILAQFDTLQSFNVLGTFSVINDAISQIVGAIAAGDTIPLPSFPEAVNIVGDYVSYAGERAFSGVSLSSQFAPLYGPLVTAVNLSASASDAEAQYASVIAASSASNGAKLLFTALAYNALWSYAFDPASTPDVSGFDGGACGAVLHGIGSCTNFGSAVVTHGGHEFTELVIPTAYPGHEGYITGDYFGWTFQITFNTVGRAIGIYYLDTGDAGHLAVSQNMGDTAYTFSAHTNAVAVQSLDHEPDDHPFVIRVCPPSG